MMTIIMFMAVIMMMMMISEKGNAHNIVSSKGKYMIIDCLPILGYSRRFGLKTGVHFLPNLVSNRVWIFRELRETLHVFIVSIKNEFEGKSFIPIWNGLQEIFLVGFYKLRNDDTIS